MSNSSRSVRQEEGYGKIVLWAASPSRRTRRVTENAYGSEATERGMLWLVAGVGEFAHPAHTGVCQHNRVLSRLHNMILQVVPDEMDKNKRKPLTV